MHMAPIDRDHVSWETRFARACSLTSQRCRASISGRWPQPQPLIAAISARSSRTQKSSPTQRRARAPSPGVALGALRADVGVARKCPILLQQPFDALFPPDTGCCAARAPGIRSASPGSTIIRSQLVRSPDIRRKPFVQSNRSKRMGRTIRSIFGR